MAENNSNESNLQLLRVNHSIKMTEAFETMFLDESLCDISICCDGEVVKAHRVILAASSSYFKQILSGINCQTQYPIIFVNGIQMSDLTSMLEFMYRGQVTIPQSQLPSLVKSAEVLGISGLCQLDPNPQNVVEVQDKSRTSSPTDSSGGVTKRGRKRKKVLQKTDNEIGSDTETQLNLKKPEENCDESEDLDTSDVKPATEKLAKSKLRSWTQQIAQKANHKEGDESQPISESETQSQQSMDESQTVSESPGSTQPKKNILKENWRHSRARRPPLKFSEYTLPKGIHDPKSTVDKTVDKKVEKEMDTETDETTNIVTTVMVRPPTPRLTRGRSRVHSNDDPKVIIPKEEPTDTESVLNTSTSSACADNQTTTSSNQTTQLTPNTRSRRQTHSPSEAKPKESESITQTSDKPTIKSEDDSSQGSTSQVRIKTPVKLQNSTPSSSSLFKWRPKDPQLTTTKFTEKSRSVSTPNEELNYQYESIEADGPPVYRCSYCEHCFRSKQNIIDHIRSVHIKSDQRYVCPLCLKKFKWKTSLNNHLNQTHPHSRPTPLRHFDKTRKSLP